MKKVYMSESVGPNSRGRSLGRWRNRVKEYMCERSATRGGGGLDQGKRECLDRERQRLFCHGHLIVGHSLRERGIRAIDRQIDSNNYRTISLLSVLGKIYGKILTERLMQVTDKKVSGEQVGFFWRGKSCMDQIIAISTLVGEYVGKDRELYRLYGLGECI